MAEGEARTLDQPPYQLPENMDIEHLRSFSCKAGKRYDNLPDSWYYLNDYGDKCFDVTKALKTYSTLVRDVRKSMKFPDVQQVHYSREFDQRKFGSASDEYGRGFTITKGQCRHEYKYAGLQVLDAQGKLQSRYSDVIFTPSRGRCHIDLFEWDSELDSTLGVIVVPLDELEEYSEEWGEERLIIGVDQDCVGAARYHIIQLARHWGLDEFWMIDDSVPTSEFKQIVWNFSERLDKAISFKDVIMAVKSLQEEFPKSALIGLTSTHSVQTLKEASSQHCINTRAPTTCVFVCLKNVPLNVIYNARLPSKEDVMFAAILIAVGKDVIIDRHIHFEDRAFAEGGCTPKAGNEGADNEGHW